MSGLRSPVEPPTLTVEDLTRRFDELSTTYTTTIQRLQERLDALATATNETTDELEELRRREPAPGASSKVLAPKPEAFTGSDFKGFLRALDLYFLANKSAFKGAQAKILYTLGLLKGDLPGVWAQNYCDSNRSVTGELYISDSWGDFTCQLHEAFGDPNEAQCYAWRGQKRKRAGTLR